MNADEALEMLRLHRMRDELFLASVEQDDFSDKTIQDRVEHMKMCYDLLESIIKRRGSISN